MENSEYRLITQKTRKRVTFFAKFPSYGPKFINSRCTIFFIDCYVFNSELLSSAPMCWKNRREAHASASLHTLTGHRRIPLPH